ncbi:hypothetical protein [Litorimonas sp. WD9-15]|uniref:hypothetical protein n=1 Tax=Litorimonas sp. WD9-15 TaxID=3418716 RepID=UPI003CFF9878
MIYRLLTTTLIACALTACGDKAAAPEKAPTPPTQIETTTPETPKPEIKAALKPGQFITGRRGVRAAKSDDIIITDDAVTLRLNPKGPSLGLSKTFPTSTAKDYVVTVDLETENVIGDLGFRMVAWALDANGAPVSRTGYTAIGRSFDAAAGRQTLTYRFGPATGETEAAERLPAGESIRFLLEPVTKSTGATARVYAMTVAQD